MRDRLSYDSITEALSQMPQLERILLQYILFMRHFSNYDFASAARILKTDRDNVSKAMKSLDSKGYILNRSQPENRYSPHDYGVNKGDELAIAVYCLSKEDKKVQEVIGEASYRWGQKIKDTVLWKIARHIAGNDSSALARLFNLETSKMTDICSDNLFGEYGDMLYCCAPLSALYLVNETALHRIIYGTSFRDRYGIDDVEKKFKRYLDRNIVPDTVSDDILDMINAFRFIHQGTPFKAKNPGDYYSLTVEGLRNLYSRNAEEALVCFNAALKQRNGEMEIKNVYYDPVLCFFHILALKVSDTEGATKKVEQFLNKKLEYSPECFLPAKMAARYVNTMVSGNAVNDITGMHIYMREYSRAGSQLEALLLNYFRSTKAGESLKVPDAGPLPAILRHELSYWDNSLKDENLAKAFGGEPILGNINSKKIWEIQLEKIKSFIAKASKDSEGEEATQEKDTRIAYLIANSRVEVREQKLMKNGNWGKGKRIAFDTFVSGKIPYADDLDRNVMIAAKRNSRSSSIDIADILGELVGCDRIFLERDMLPVSVLEDRIFLDITRSGSSLLFKTNVDPNLLKNGYLHFYSCSKDGHTYKIVKVTKQQAEILNFLLQIGRFPLEAEESLKEILPKLGTVVEIHSDMIEGGSSLEKKEGNPAIFLRITPRSEDFLVHAFVRPLDGGTFTSLPGEGSKVIYDIIEGKRFQVTRTLKAESDSYAEYNDYCAEELGLVPNEEGKLQLYPEELLKVLDNFGKDARFIFEWPEGKSIRIKGTLSSDSFKMSLHSRESWFDVEGQVEIDGEIISAAAILDLINIGGMTNYIRLSEGEYLKISESLRKQLQKLESLTISSRGKVSISAFKVGQVAEILKTSGLDIKTDKAFNELLEKIETSSKLSFDVPPQLNATLRDYQMEGFEWMARLDSWGGGACLADDMGLGKTVQAIAFMLMKKDKGPSLVVSPTSVLLNWQREISRFAPSMKVSLLNMASDRRSMIEDAGSSEIILCTYGLLVSESELISSKNWNVACLDEAHTIKNRDTKMSAAAMKISASSRIILTGTPVQNHLGELWNLFQFLNPGLLGSFEQFQSKFTIPIENGNKDRSNQLRRIIQPFILRRTKAEVVDELPEKTDITRLVEFSKEETFFYESLRKKAEESLALEGRVNVNTLAQITILREAACSPKLVSSSWSGSESKITALMELIPEIMEGGNSLIVFSQFTSFLHLCEEHLEKAGIPYYFLEGSTPIKKREAMVQDFQAGKRRLFLISLKAGGLGLNLTGANYVIHLDPWWNPAIEQQATDRAYRIGQKQPVTVYHLISRSTIEEKITRLHKFKRDLADAILEGTNVSHALTLEELMELVK